MNTTADLAREEPEGTLGGQLDDESMSTLLGVAKSAYSGGQLTEAREILHGLVVAQRSHAQAWSLLGDVERSAGNLEDARDAYGFALSLSNDDLGAAVALAEIHHALGDHEKSLALLTWVTLNAPSDRKDIFDRVGPLSDALARASRGDA